MPFHLKICKTNNLVNKIKLLICRLMIQSLSVCCVIVQLDLICATKGTMDWVQKLKSVNFALIVWFCTALIIC